MRRANLQPQVGIDGLRMTASAETSENPELWQGTKTLDKQLRVRIDDEWYDLSRWRNAHPAGSHWIDLYKDRDATEVMYGFHSQKGMDMIKRLPKAKTIPENVPPMSEATMNFRKWRADLVKDGWFEVKLSYPFLSCPPSRTRISPAHVPHTQSLERKYMVRAR